MCRELQFRVCNHSEPRARPPRQWPAERGEDAFMGRGSCEGYTRLRVHGFPLAESLPGRKRRSFFMLRSVIITGLRASPSGLPTLFKWGLCLLISHTRKGMTFYWSSKWFGKAEPRAWHFFHMRNPGFERILKNDTSQGILNNQILRLHVITSQYYSTHKKA